MQLCLSAPLVFLLLLSAPESTLCIVKVTLQRMQCSISPTYIANLTTSVVNNAINLNLTIVRSFTQGYKGNVDLQMRLARSAKYQSLLTYNVDVCDIMHSVQQLKIMHKWYKKLQKFGNFMENCPILEGNYYLRNVTVDSSNIAPYLQAGAYRIVAHTYYGKYKAKTEKFVADCLVAFRLQ